MRRLLIALAFTACNGIVQSPECAQYLACAEAIVPGGADTFLMSYGPRGTCWSTDQASADRCTAACLGGRQTLSLGPGAGKPECL